MKRLAHYSQYFLRDPALISELIGHSNIKKTDLVYDLGAGSGAISAALAKRAGAVVAVEVEPRMAEKLRENMWKHENVQVIEADILEVPLPNKPYKVFANIPFHISADIVRRLVFGGTPLQSAFIIVQKQFANKLLIERSPFTGQLGAAIAPWVSVRIRRPLKKTDYWPHPNVDTVFIEITPRPTPLIPLKLADAYVKMVTDSYHDPKVFKKLPLAKMGIGPDVRPSQVMLAQWVMLFDAVR